MREYDRSQFPDWAKRERLGDLGWIEENHSALWSVAQGGYEDFGRGAIVVDTLHLTDEGNSLIYLTQEMAEECGDIDLQRMVGEYDPQEELVVTFWKTDNRVSTYRLKHIESAEQETSI